MNRQQRKHLAELRENIRIGNIRATMLVLALTGGVYFGAYIRSIILMLIFSVAALGFAYAGRIVYKANKSNLEDFERDYRNMDKR